MTKMRDVRRLCGSQGGERTIMSLRVSGKNINIGEALRAHVTDRLNSATDKFFDGGAVSGHVTIGPEGPGFRADCAIHLASGVVLQTDGRAQEPYAAFDQAALRLEQRLRRYKRRLKNHHGVGAEDAAAPHEVAASYVIEAPDSAAEEAPSAFNAAVIAESTTQLRKMSVSDAVIHLDMTGSPVVMFRHATTGRLNVVYRRGDENIGWLDAPSA
jgi:ribosomal subunit interface protein